MQRTYYAPTFLDESMSAPDRRGKKRPTGRLSGIVFARKFWTARGGTIKSERMVISFAWDRDTEEAKAEAVAKVIDGMDGELPELDNNPPTTWVPDFIKKEMSREVPKDAVC